MRTVLAFISIALLAFSCVGCLPRAQTETKTCVMGTSGTAGATCSSYPIGSTDIFDDASEFSISRFLTETNFYGKITPRDELVAPGTLPEVSQIPAADQTLVGAQVLINLSSGAIPVSFLYHLEPTSGVEKLAAVIYCDNIPMLIVFRTNFGSVTSLCEAFATGEVFSATILAVCNISFEECMYAFSVSENNGEDPVDYHAPQIVDGEEAWLVGYFGEIEGQSICMVFRANAQAMKIYDRIFTRFSVTKEDIA